MPQPDLFTTSTLSVSDLTGEIKSLLEGNFFDVRVEGEISNASTSRNGHTYFTLKDDDAQLSCVIWSSTARRMGAELIDGQQIIAGGDIQVYPPHGKYQLIVRSVKQAGIGALQKAFEKLKDRLKGEGLFDDVHKKALPKFPFNIGVITSATGAAFHDIRDTLERRWPITTVHLHHASVQGVNAAPELVRAINYFSEKQHVDVLIVGRGGGSLEDLWPFNEEAVARALFDCEVPTISAVGHEVDFSISDFVADARAATPTQAAILAAPDVNEIRLFSDGLSTRLHDAIDGCLSTHKDFIQQLVQSHALMAVKHKVTGRRDRIKNLTESLNHHRKMYFIQNREQLNGLHHRLELKNPNKPLEQGFVRVEQNGKWIKKAKKFAEEEAFKMTWGDETIEIKQ
ncbi:MAG TPA: exodeoxyribonuclease VII large subunit [Balneolaceae bacterium]